MAILKQKRSEMSVWQQPEIVEWTQLLLNSYRHWLGTDLIERQGAMVDQARGVFECQRIVVSHGLEDDPMLNYGNRAALSLWEMPWEQLIQMPSRLTAEPVDQAERAEMLRKARSQGYIDDYRGVRISKTGKRFLVEAAIVWNVVDGQGVQHGQAATFSKWSYV